MTMYSALATVLMLAPHIATASNSYESFRHTHRRAASVDNDVMTYEERMDLFNQRKKEVLAHNARNLSWTMTVNRFADYSPAELGAMLGYKRVGGRWGGAPSGTSSFIEQHEEHDNLIDTSTLASEVDWRTSLVKSAGWIRNQGSCGSCWAVASVGALEMHAEKAHGSVQKLSHQQLVDCTPNPRHCGGTGGCAGATAELAFQYTRKFGISADATYQSSSGGKCNTDAPAALKVSRFVRLPENKGSHLLHAVATRGPVVVSVDGGNWFNYDSGVFSGCEQDTVVNHAVLAVGYGKDATSQKDYWNIRNSWGKGWGDHGFIKVERHSDDNAYCGMDNKPKDGVFCDDAPASVPICGMCGITSDSAYPSIISRSKNAAEHRRGNIIRSKLISNHFQMDTVTGSDIL